MNTSRQIDKELLIDLRSGSLAAFEQILNSFKDQILNYVYRIVRQRQDAEDITQETFIRLYENAGDVNPEGNFRGWLYRIATNVSFDWLRKKKRLKEIPLLGDNQAITGVDAKEAMFINQTNVSYSYALSSMENEEDITKALAKLKPVHQTFLLLFYYNDFSYREISYIMGMPESSVKSNLYTARRKLKETLLKNGFVPPKNLRAQKNYGLSFSKN